MFDLDSDREFKVDEITLVEMVKQAYDMSKQDKSDYMKDVAEWRASYDCQSVPKVEDRSQFETPDTKTTMSWWVANLIEPFVSTNHIVRLLPQSINSAKVSATENLLNYQFCRRMDRFTFMREAGNLVSRDGLCFVRTGWNYDYVWEDKMTFEGEILENYLSPSTEMDLDGEPIIGEIDGLLQSGYEVMESTEDEDGNVKKIVLARKKVTCDDPTADLMLVDDVFPDPACTDLAKAQYFIIKYDTTISELKANDIKRNPKGIYKGIDRIIDKLKQADADKEATETDDNDMKSANFNFDIDDSRRKVTLYEYWGLYDIDKDGISEQVCITMCEEFIIRKMLNPYPDNQPPIIPFYFQKQPGGKWGVGLPAYTQVYQKIMTTILRGMIDKIAYGLLSPIFTKKGALDHTNRKILLERKPGSVIEVDIGNGSLRDFIHEYDTQQLSPDLFRLVELIEVMKENHSGHTRYSQGLDSASLNKTATGITAIMNQSQKRVVEIAMSIGETMLKPLFRKWISYNKEFFTETTIEDVTGKPLEVMSDHIDDSTKDMEIMINVRGVDEMKATQLIQAMQYTQPLVASGILPPAILLDFIKKLYDLLGFKDTSHKVEQLFEQQAEMQMGQEQLGGMPVPPQDIGGMNV